MLPCCLLLLPAAAFAGAPGAVGDLYVTAFYDAKVMQFDGVTGAYVGDFVTSGSGGLLFPAGLTWGPNGNLFVVSYGTSEIIEYDGTSGAYVRTIVGPFGEDSGWLSATWYCTFGPDGNLYATGEDNESVLRYDGGTGEWLWPTFGVSDYTADAHALAFGPNGNLFVVSGAFYPQQASFTLEMRAINEFHGATGRFQRAFGVGDNVDLYPIDRHAEYQALVFQPDGNLLVTYNEWDKTRNDIRLSEVRQFDVVSGADLGAFVTDGSGGLAYAADLTYGPDGDLFVTSFWGDKVIEYDGDTGALVGTFANVSGPYGLAFKPAPPDPLPAPAVTGVSVSQHNACESLTGVVVTGGNLDAGATVMLQDPNEQVGTSGFVSTYVGVVTGGSGDGASLTVDFDLDGGARMAGGLWDVVVQNPDGQADTLSGAIDVAPCWTAGEGNLFVLGTRHRGPTRHGLFEFDGATGDLIGFLVEDPTGSLGSDLKGASGFAFGADGMVLIATRGSSPPQYQVLRYDGVTGRKLGEFIPAGAGGILWPRKIIHGPNGNLFVLHETLDGTQSGVLEFDALTGAFVKVLVPLTSTLASPGELAFGPDGDVLYVSNASYPQSHADAGLHVFDSHTGVHIAGPWAVPCGDCRRWAIEFDRDNGDLLLPLWSPTAPLGEGLARITVHDRLTGALLGTVIPPPAGDIQQAVAADFGPNGHLFVAGGADGFVGGYVCEYDLLNGEAIGVFATQANASGPSDARELLFKPLLGDRDGDWDRDLADFAALQRAFGGPGPGAPGPANYNDLTFDFDRDGDVDADDFTEFVKRMTPPKDWSAPTGPCCLPDGGCMENTTARQCVVDLGGSWLGSAGACPDDCPPFGACCDPIDGACTARTEEQCSYAGGVYQGDGTDCSTAGCPPAGACCSPDDNSCQELTELACLDAGGMYQGDYTECATTTCPFGRYSNEIDPMTQAAVAGAGLQLADDLTLAGAGARDLTYLDLRVYGNGGGAFDVTVSLYDACPGAGGTIIPGTTFTWTAVPDDGYVYTLVVDPVDPPVTIPDTVWMAATFSTPESGWIIAEQAEIGSTADVYARDDPWTCTAAFGGDPYAGLWANLECVVGGGKSRGDGEPRLGVIRLEKATNLTVR